MLTRLPDVAVRLPWALPARGAPDSTAVAVGQARTGRLITSAALLFCVAVGAVGTSRIVWIKETTLGSASA